MVINKNILNEIYESYLDFKEPSIKSTRFKHSDIQPLISKLNSSDLFKVSDIGNSVEDRIIKMIKFGTGKTKVLCWSQMHGDEPTATMALFDLFNFFTSSDKFNELKKKILEELTIYVIPMLNPDGAERYTRRNALGIDLNRDAIRLESVEAKILKDVRDDLEPEFGFNLHNQTTRYTVSGTGKQVAFSFLAPAYNHRKEINNVRKKTMQTIVNIYDDLNQFIPGHIGKYDDAFEPRAYGDSMIKWGTSSLLVETGGWPDDDDHQFLRKLNFMILISGLNSISSKKYESVNIDKYFRIPDNGPLLYDLILKHVTIEKNSKKYKVDIGINYDETNSGDLQSYYYKGKIIDIGDLSTINSISEYNCDGLKLANGKIYGQLFSDFTDLNDFDLCSVIKNGYTTIKMEQCKEGDNFTKYPVNILLENAEVKHEIEIESFANFALYNDKNEIEYVCINGFICDTKCKKNCVKNGIIFR